MWEKRKGAIKVPCVECDKRGCGTYHSQCPEYIEYKKKIDELRESKHKDDGIMEYKMKRRSAYRRSLDKNSPMRSPKR